jgi:ADP-ribosylglycohydrolase
MMFGLAIGDALAAPCEFISHHDIVSRYGKKGPAAPSRKVTDDTQMALAVAEALLAAPRPLAPASLERALREAFVAWNTSPDNDRAPGTTCIDACNRLADGRDWIDATVLNSKGCGANMRVAPVALLNFDRDGVTRRIRAAVAQFQAALTHGHPTALAAADLTAAAIAELLSAGRAGIVDLTDRLRDYALSQRFMYHERWLGELWRRPNVASPQDFIARGWDECLAAIDRVDSALAAETRIDDVSAFAGEGWVAEEALACAVLCVMIHPDDPVKSIRQASLANGDSDSIAAIAGALSGAAHGITAWPAEWVGEIELTDRLARVARAWDGEG